MNKKILKPPLFGNRIEVYRSIDSTQDRVREIFKENPEESLVIAEEQTAGKGRRGRQWISPDGGLYFSMLIKHSGVKDLFSINALVAALESFEKQNKKVQWKWPNDLFFNGNKAGGILSEVLSDEWIAVGVGINTGLSNNDFSGELKNNISIIDIDKEKFIKNFISILREWINNRKLDKKCLNYLNNCHVMQGKNIKVGEVEGEVSGIDEYGALEVISNGAKNKIITGTILEVNYKDTCDIDLIAIDIGNTNTRVGVFRSGNAIESFDIPTKPHDDFSDRLTGALKDTLKDKKDFSPGIAVSCVVTPVENDIITKLSSEISSEILNVTSVIDTGLIFKVKDSSQVGADRICNAVAANRIYGGNIVVIDLGTANTFDVISSAGEYLGGVIAPGLDSMKDALVQRADKLMQTEFSMPGKVIGDETAASMNAGFYYTLKGQLECITKAIRDELKQDFKIIYTGGGVKNLDYEFTENCILDTDITLKGLAGIFKRVKQDN